ncbi:hypothetical protein LEMLEM_LOCUS374 [Lemmus lemmus]
MKTLRRQCKDGGHTGDISTDKPRNAKMVATIRSQERGKRCCLLQSPSKNGQC